MAQETRSKKLPDMSDWTDEQIAEFWETHDSTDYVDQMEEAAVQIEVPEDYRVISLRLDAKDIESVKEIARKKGVPYTVLLRMWIKDHLSSSES